VFYIRKISLPINRKEWCEHLPSVTAAYRSSVHSSTGFSPNLLVFGRELNAPIDLVLARPDEPEHVSYYDFIERKLSLIKLVHDFVRQELNAQSARFKSTMMPTSFTPYMSVTGCGFIAPTLYWAIPKVSAELLCPISDY